MTVEFVVHPMPMRSCNSMVNTKESNKAFTHCVTSISYASWRCFLVIDVFAYFHRQKWEIDIPWWPTSTANFAPSNCNMLNSLPWLHSDCKGHWISNFYNSQRGQNIKRLDTSSFRCIWNWWNIVCLVYSKRGRGTYIMITCNCFTMVSVNCSAVQLLVIDLRSNTTAIENLDIFGHHLIDTILLLYAEPSLLQQLY